MAQGTGAPGSSGEYVVVEKNGKPVAMSAELAKVNGDPVIQGGFGSREEAQTYADAALANANAPGSQAVRQTQQTNEQVARGPSAIDAAANRAGGIPRRFGEDMQTLSRIAFPEGVGMSPIPGSPEEILGPRSMPGLETGPPERRRSAASVVPPEAIPTSPVPMYGGDPFAGTWAEGTDPNVFTNIISGQMTPGAAVNNIANAAGMPTYGNRDFLEQQYQDFDLINQLSNPGQPFLDPDQRYVQAGDFVQHWMQPENGIADINGQGLYDNMFSDAYSQQLTGLVAGEENPGEAERNMIQANVAALQPHIGNENAAFISNQVDKFYDMYIAGGYNATMPFTEFLRQNGAEDWA